MVESYGVHRVRHGSVMDDLSELMRGDKADIFYSDPPWGDGNLKYWQTMNQKHNPGVARKDIPLPLFLDRIFQVAVEYSKGVILIEYGKRWERNLLEVAERHGLHHKGRAVTVYSSQKLEMHLHLFHKDQAFTAPAGYFDAVAGTWGYKTISTACRPFVKSGGIVMDPCCGLGYSAKVAVDNGMMFRGNELNRKRLSRTIARLVGR